MRRVLYSGLAAVLLASGAGIVGYGSSHREAPGITKTPKVDGTDFYMFRSYEPGRSDFVTLIANYYPFQEPFGGPNYYMPDEDAVYEIHVDNNGDSLEDLTFQFQFQHLVKNFALPVGGQMVPIPLIIKGPVGPEVVNTENLNVEESYTLRLIRGSRRSGQAAQITNAANGSGTFRKPVDRIGDKTLNMYDTYADNHIYDIDIPGCAAGGRVFVGQRREGFVINVGEVFDLVNTNPLGPVDAEPNDLSTKNITTFALEVPISCLVAGDPVIGAWQTASAGRGTPASGGAACAPGQPSSPKPAPNWVPTSNCTGWVPPGHPEAAGGSFSSSGTAAPATLGSCPTPPSSPKPAPNWEPSADCTGWVPPGHPDARSAAGGGPGVGTPSGQFTQVSRLGHPLVNEVIIGLPDKDTFNGSDPNGDAQFLRYVTNPTLPALIEVLFGVPAPPTPRNDLVQVFLTGIPGLNQPTNATPSEVLRLNTSTPAIAEGGQNPLGVIGGDVAGFPNGRRPGDDVVDVALRVVEGLLLSSDPASFPKFTDGAFIDAEVAYDPTTRRITMDPSLRLFRNSFPYLRAPLSSSPNPFHQ